MLAGALLAGCGDSSAGSKAGSAANRSTPTSAEGSTTTGAASPGSRHVQAAGQALAVCKGVVERTSLSASGKREIIVLCAKIGDLVRENESIMRAVCQEVASATAPSSDGSAAKRVYAACYAEYAKTLD